MGEITAAERIRLGQTCIERDGKVHVARSLRGEEMTKEMWTARTDFEEGDVVQFDHAAKTIVQAKPVSE